MQARIIGALAVLVLVVVIAAVLAGLLFVAQQATP